MERKRPSGSEPARPRPPRPESPRREGQPPPSPAGLQFLRRWLLVLLGMLILNWLIGSVLFPGHPTRITFPYTFFKEQVQAGTVVEITGRGEAIQGTLKQPVTYPPSGPEARTHAAVGLPELSGPQAPARVGVGPNGPSPGMS